VKNKDARGEPRTTREAQGNEASMEMARRRSYRGRKFYQGPASISFYTINFFLFNRI